MEKTVEENNRITKMEKSVEEIKTDVSEIKSALIGNPLSGEGGVVGQVSLLRSQIEYLKKDIRELQEEKAINKRYFAILGVAATALLVAVLKLIL